MRAMQVAAIVLMLAVVRCKPDLRLAATNLQVTPDPARPGDTVRYTFRLTLLPAQGYTVRAFVDTTVHATVRGDTAFDGFLVIDMGAAVDLIALYGAGVREAAVDVRLDDRNRTTTATRTFTLDSASAP